MYMIVEPTVFDGEDTLMVMAAFDTLVEAKEVFDEAEDSNYRIIRTNAETGFDYIV